MEKQFPTYDLERQCAGRVVGVDEAGRGPWAGPVVAAAVWLDPERIPDGLNDSKKLSEPKREALFDALQGVADIGVGAASVAEIDALNIAQATFLAMRRALDGLTRPVDLALIDGNRAPKLACETRTVVKGDSRSLSIAAASIIAKVTRDRWMKELAAEWPGYGWEQNKGYGVKTHQEALKSLGVTPEHRRSFAPIHNMLCAESA